MYEAASSRYEKMTYNRCGQSGIKLPVLSLGLWQNFGFDVSMSSIKERLFTAFKLGIDYFDLATNYGPP